MCDGTGRRSLEEKVRIHQGLCHVSAWCAWPEEIKMLSDKWLCVPRHGTMTDWPITRHKGGKPMCNVHKGSMDAHMIRISLIKYR